MASNQTTQPKDSVRQKKTSPTMSTQLFLDIAEIKDNVVVLKNGGLRAVLQTSSINFNLKSEAEQNAIIYGYQNFLNSLEFPVQIVIQSRKLDVDKYIENVREIGENHTNVLLKEQTIEYCDYIQKLVEYADIMEKKFYVVVPYDPYRAREQSAIAKFMSSISASDSVEAIRRRHKEFDAMNKGLTERINAVMGGLENCNLRIARLSTSQLIELFYQIYNPITSRNEKIEDMEKMDIQDL